MTTPLTDILTPSARKLVYVLYVVVGFIVGGVQVAYASIPDQDTPTALTVAINVLAYAGIGLGLTAASNITPSTPVPVEVVKP